MLKPSKKTVRVLGVALCLCLAMLLAGCMVGPDYQTPQVPVPENWAGQTPEAAKQAKPDPDAELATWWTIFQDPQLSSLVKRAMENNLDLKQAEARIQQARASLGVATGELGPEVDSSGSFSRSRSAGSSSSGSGGNVSNQYQAGFDAAWELDIFGGVRRGVEAARADLQAAVEDRRDVLVTLAGDVARNYLELRIYQQRIAIARQNIEAQRKTVELTRQRFEAGFEAGLDMANAEAQMASTDAQIPNLESSARQSIYSLSILLGQEPAALVAELSPEARIPLATPSVPVGLPSDLLRRRPDIRMAEAQVHSATAQIGVATADLFPSFNLTGSAGFQADVFSSWFDWVNRFWSFGPSLSWNIFSTGRTLSNIELQKALTEEQVIAYRQTVLTAMQDVENALIAYQKEQEHKDKLVVVVTQYRKALALATELYTQGETDFLSVTSAQASLYSAEDSLVQSKGTLGTELISLYKALGGGWQMPDSAKAAAQ